MVPADSILEYIPISQNLFCFDSKKREKNDIKMPIFYSTTDKVCWTFRENIAKRKTYFYEEKLMVLIWANNMSFSIYTVVGYIQFALNVASYLLIKTSPLSNDADADII